MNRNYIPSLYSEYSTSCRRNLGRVDEARIDLDMMEALVEYCVEKGGAEGEEGAILVFLPGANVSASTPYEIRKLRLMVKKPLTSR